MPRSNQDRRIYARLWQRLSLKHEARTLQATHFYNVLTFLQ